MQFIFHLRRTTEDAELGEGEEEEAEVEESEEGEAAREEGGGEEAELEEGWEEEEEEGYEENGRHVKSIMRRALQKMDA